MGLESLQSFGFGGKGLTDALPKILAELQGLRLNVVSGQTNGTVNVVPNMDAEDTIVAVANLTDDAAVSVANITIVDRRASCKITCLNTAQDGDTVTINGKVYTFKSVPSLNQNFTRAPFTVPMVLTPSGSDDEAIAAQLAIAIMSGDSTLFAQVINDANSPPEAAIVQVFVRLPGQSGNAYGITETGTSVTIGAGFGGGTDPINGGFKSTDSLSGKKLLVQWFDKNREVLSA